MHAPFDRIARIAAAIAAVAALAGLGLGIAVESTARTPEDALASPMAIAAMAASLVGLVALVVSTVGLASSPVGGRVGTAGKLLAVVGATLTSGAVWSGLALGPWFATAVPADVAAPETLPALSSISYAVLGLGSVLLGIALHRERATAGWISALLIVGGILCLPPFLPARYTLVVVGIALHLLRRPGQAAVAAAPESA